MSNVAMISILPLLVASLFVGVVQGRAIDADGDLDVLQPITSRSRQRRICVELCMSGLGGAPACGADCVDLVPSNLPLKYVSENDSVSTSSHARYTMYGVCEVLCKNNLGDPLCQCEIPLDPTKEPNFFEVCSAFCTKFNYRLYGCQKCSLYNGTTTASNTEFSNQSLLISGAKTKVDWDVWCQKMCQNGDGGAACNCDLLPMSLVIDN